MKTHDLVMLVLLGIGWLFYRKKYDRNDVVLYYKGGVFLAECFLRSADSLNLQEKSRDHIWPGVMEDFPTAWLS